MARNTLAGKGKSKNTEKTGRDYAKEYREYQVKRKKYRTALNKKNRDAGTYGNKDQKDVSHTKSGRTVSEPESKNRRRNGRNGKSTKK